MAVKYAMCVSCGNTRERDEIYACPKCGHRFCYKCKDTKYGVHPVCPICGNDEPKQIGEIGDPNE